MRQHFAECGNIVRRTFGMDELFDQQGDCGDGGWNSQDREDGGKAQLLARQLRHQEGASDAAKATNPQHP